MTAPTRGDEPADATTPPPDAPAPTPPPAERAASEPGGDDGASMGRNAALLTAGTLLSRVLGLLRETLIASQFASADTDAFFLAWRVPNALRALLAEGAATSVLTPILGEALYGKVRGGAKDPARLREAVAEVKGVALVVLGVTTALGVAFARPVLSLMAGGDFRRDPARFEPGVGLLAVLFPYIFLMGWFAIGNTTLRTLGNFRPGAFAPVMLNVAFLVAPFAFTPLLLQLGVGPIYSLAVAALLGGVLQVAWLLPALRREDAWPRPVLRASERVRELGVLFLPMLYGQAVYQLNVILSGKFLSGLPTGQLSFFSYAQRLADIPQGLFTTAFAGAALAAMQRDASHANLGGVARTYERAMRMAAFVALPTAVILAAYADAIAPLVFGYGRLIRDHGERGPIEVAASLRWQAGSVALLAFVHQTSTVFSALKQRRVVVVVATVSLAAFAATAAALTPRMQHTGVAAAMVASSAVQLALLLVAVRRLVPAVDFGAVFPTLAKALAAAGVTALAARAAVGFLPVTGPSVGARVLAVAVGGALGALYLLAAWVLRCDEMLVLQEKLRGLARRRRRRPG